MGGTSKHAIAVVVMLAGLLTAVPMTMPTAAHAAGTATVTFVDVRQGDALVFQGPCGDIGVIDTPRYRKADTLATINELGGLSDVQWVSVSHYDSDHLGDDTGLLGLIKDAHAANPDLIVYDRGGDRNAKDTATYRNYFDYVTGHSLREPVGLDTTWTLCPGEDPMTFSVVGVNGRDDSGDLDGTATEENDLGVCLRVDLHHFAMGTCGDVNGTDEGSRTNIEAGVVDELAGVQLVKTSHHGSAHSNHQTWVATLAAAGLEAAVTSVGQNSYGHPSPAVLDRYTNAGVDNWIINYGSLPGSDGSGNDDYDGQITVSTTGFDQFRVVPTIGPAKSYPLAANPDPRPDPSGSSQGSYYVNDRQGSWAWAADCDTIVVELIERTSASPVAGQFQPYVVHAEDRSAVDAAWQWSNARFGSTEDNWSFVRFVLNGVDPATDYLIRVESTYEPGWLSFPERLITSTSDCDPGGVPAVEHPPAPAREKDWPEPNDDVFNRVRVAGMDRVRTALSVAEVTWPDGAETVVVAAAGSFPDALAGATLAGLRDAPVVLVGSDPVHTSNIVTDMHPARAVVLGGTAAIPEQVVTDLRSHGVIVERVGGTSRYETARQITERAAADGADMSTIYLVVGDNFPDAVAASAAAAASHRPLLLTPPNRLHPDTAAVLAEFQPDTIIVIGGAAAVSAAVADDAAAAAGGADLIRLEGGDRYATAAAVAHHSRTVGLTVETAVWAATGANFPDALSAGPAAAHLGSMLLLVPPHQLTPPGEAFADGRNCNAGGLVVVGGVAAVSEATADQLAARLNC